MGNDVFANIATNGIGGRQEFLCNPEPIERKKNICLLENGGEAVSIKPKLSTKEELYSELGKMREYYKPFLKNLAPSVREYTKRQYIRKFILNGEKEIEIPEFEGPVGYAKKVYESDFEIDEQKKGQGILYLLYGCRL